MTKAPVIPIGLWGTEKVWPRSSRLPNVLNVTDPPEVRVRVGAPVELKYRSLDADTKRIMAAISKLLPPSRTTPADADARRAGGHLSAGLPGRTGAGGRTPAGHGLIAPRPRDSAP